MLVLSRKIGEELYINRNVALKVIDVNDGRVRIGIEASENCHVQRQDIAERSEIDSTSALPHRPALQRQTPSQFAGGA